MSLTWHIVKKDLRALKWPLLVWVLLIVAKLGIGVVLLNASGEEGIGWFAKMNDFANLLGALELVSFVLTAALIQGDSLVGTKAFWMTRPISGARLLRAKLLGLGLIFGLVPVLVTLPWWLWCGYDASQIAWAGAETAAIQASAVLVGLMWSTLTDGFGRFLMWTIVTLFAVPTLAGSLLYWLSRLQHTHGPSGTVMITRIILGCAVAVVGILTVVIHQYLTRNTRRSMTVILSTAGLIVVIGIVWPWNLDIDGRAKAWFERRTIGEWPAATAPADLKYSISSAAVSGPGERNGSVGALQLGYRVDGLAASQILLFYGGEFSLRWPDGKVEPLHARAQFGGTANYYGKIHGLTERALRPEHYARIQAGFGGRLPDSVSTLIGLNPWVVERFKTEAPVCTLTARLRLMEFESIAPVPLESGANRPVDDRNERVAHAEKSGDELHVVFIRSLPSPWVDNAGGWPLSHLEPLVQYFLVNKEQDLVDRGRTVDFRLARIGGVGVSWHTIAYQASRKVGGRRPLLEAMQALDSARMIKVTYREQARFSQVITTDNLRARWEEPRHSP